MQARLIDDCLDLTQGEDKGELTLVHHKDTGEEDQTKGNKGRNGRGETIHLATLPESVTQTWLRNGPSRFSSGRWRGGRGHSILGSGHRSL